ncbi:hypothetical protein PHACT_12740 [Pseudohongiella acticola]|uniref:Uncharacterized protein n=1 Tax=Pseudohongiella acticola TaxID=1524254 RepID=A0A1E8CGS8_9GAMM|nr:hypothetical protein [Pseudohongiella acticola]OFE11417.1 hypothetical protein PHACT_12740 [Pseudohongiella acticola]
MSFAQPIQSVDSGLEESQVSRHWWKGSAAVGGIKGAFFARTRGELVFKYREWMKQFQRQPVTSEERATFRDRHGFGAGDQVHYTPDYSGLGYTVQSLRQPHRVYTIALTAHQNDGTPVAWLNGVPGCVPVSRLSHSATGGDAA